MKKPSAQLAMAFACEGPGAYLLRTLAEPDSTTETTMGSWMLEHHGGKWVRVWRRLISRRDWELVPDVIISEMLC